MKRIAIIASIVLLLVSCRKEADYVPYVGEPSKLAYSTYTEQFDYLWKTISTAYVFWDVDTVDWDAAYERYRPRFEALDLKFADSGYVRTSEFSELYTGLIGPLRDHHLTFIANNLHPAPGEWGGRAVVQPGNMEVSQRDYYIEGRDKAVAKLRAFQDNMPNLYTIGVYGRDSASIPEMGGAIVEYRYYQIILEDGRVVPYLWQSMAAITPVMRDMKGSGAQIIIDAWLSEICNTPRDQIAGIILDNRANRGGFQDDLDYLVGPFINKRTEIFKTRYKEGPGRLEYSAWCPYYQDTNREYRRDITAEGIPYVVLTDVLSVSMGEIEPIVIKAVLPTAHIIGERTFGGTGPLQTNQVDLNYGGPFGRNGEDNHYVYTSTFETLIGGRVREGEGLVPDEELLRKDFGGDYKPQLDAALDYIRAH